AHRCAVVVNHHCFTVSAFLIGKSAPPAKVQPLTGVYGPFRESESFPDFRPDVRESGRRRRLSAGLAGCAHHRELPRNSRKRRDAESRSLGVARELVGRPGSKEFPAPRVGLETAAFWLTAGC